MGPASYAQQVQTDWIRGNQPDRILFLPWSVTKAISALMVQTNMIDLYTVFYHKGYLGVTGPYKPDRTLYRGLSQRLSQHYWSIQT